MPPNHEDRVVIQRFVVQWVTIKNLIYELKDIGASNFFNRPSIITNKKEPHTYIHLQYLAIWKYSFTIKNKRVYKYLGTRFFQVNNEKVD